MRAPRGVPRRRGATTVTAAAGLLAALGLAACTTDHGEVIGAAVDAIRVPADLPRDLGERAMTHVRATVAFGARHSGTDGWQRSVDYIAATLAGAGLAVQRDRWTETSEGLVFENVRAVVPGRRPDRIVIGAHHDTKITSGHPDPEHNYPFVGANDPGSGVGLLLALAEHFARGPQPEATLELVFFDGEESIPYTWDASRALFGSRRYVAHEVGAIEAGRAAPIRAMVLLDMVGARDLTIDNEEWSTPGLREIVGAAATALGHRRYFFANSMQIRDDHLPFLDAGIPAVDLIDLVDNPQWHTPDDTLEHLSTASMQIVGEVVLTALPAVVAAYVTASR